MNISQEHIDLIQKRLFNYEQKCRDQAAELKAVQKENAALNRMANDMGSALVQVVNIKLCPYNCTNKNACQDCMVEYYRVQPGNELPTCLIELLK